MRRLILFLLAGFLLATTPAQADAVIASVQKALKDQGFYYGEITGQKDADTTAALRRYQIRNGLHITGELNAETQKSLGVKGSVAPRPTPTPPHSSATPVPRVVTPVPPVAAPQDNTSDLRDDTQPRGSYDTQAHAAEY